MDIKTMFILLTTNENDFVNELNKAASEISPEKISTTDNILQLLGLCLLLVIILVAAYYTSKFVGRFKLGQLKDSNIQVIESYRISTNKMLQIVKIANKYVVIGVSKDHITNIIELDEDEVVTRTVDEGSKQSFRQILEKFRGNKE